MPRAIHSPQSKTSPAPRFDDTLIGDAADNVLEGGARGRDTLDGGAGADTASWAASDLPQLQLTFPPARIPVGTRQAIQSPTIESLLGSRYSRCANR